jgi:hypothetical protein
MKKILLLSLIVLLGCSPRVSVGQVWVEQDFDPFMQKEAACWEVLEINGEYCLCAVSPCSNPEKPVEVSVFCSFVPVRAHLQGEPNQ